MAGRHRGSIGVRHPGRTRRRGPRPPGGSKTARACALRATRPTTGGGPGSAAARQLPPPTHSLSPACPAPRWRRWSTARASRPPGAAARAATTRQED